MKFPHNYFEDFFVNESSTTLIVKCILTNVEVCKLDTIGNATPKKW